MGDQRICQLVRLEPKHVQSLKGDHEEHEMSGSSASCLVMLRGRCQSLDHEGQQCRRWAGGAEESQDELNLARHPCIHPSLLTAMWSREQGAGGAEESQDELNLARHPCIHPSLLTAMWSRGQGSVLFCKGTSFGQL